MKHIILLIITHLISFFIGYKIKDKILNKFLNDINNNGSFSERYAANIIKQKKQNNLKKN